MENETEKEVKLRTANQEMLVNKLLKSKKILDKEYREFSNLWKTRITDSYDASVFIAHLLALLQYRRRFQNGNHIFL